MTESDPWKAEPLGEDRYEFTNVSGRKLAAITVDPFPGGEVEIEDNAGNVPGTVRNREPGESFTAKVRGSVRIMATDPATYEPVAWKFDAP